uniref:Proline rich coiled-coil 2B n=1 Tax=Echinostoma caproni TaxID=27848 RepID=A0A183B7X9_9TREM
LRRSRDFVPGPGDSTVTDSQSSSCQKPSEFSACKQEEEQTREQLARVEVSGTQEGSREDLDTEELDTSHAWHRVGRAQWNSGNNLQQQPLQPPNHTPAHPRQRYPSGPHGDADSNVPSTTNAPLRPAPDTRRGGHGDWSRGCAGWRQRSYSGSERATVVVGQHPRGRGTGTLFGSEADDSHARGRGRGRGLNSGAGVGRFTFSHRGGGIGRATHSNMQGSLRSAAPSSGPPPVIYSFDKS